MPSTECRVHVHFTVHKNVEDFQSKAEEMIKIIKVGIDNFAYIFNVLLESRTFNKVGSIAGERM